MARASLPNSGQTCKGAAGIGAPTAPESGRVRGLARSRVITGGDGGDWWWGGGGDLKICEVGNPRGFWILYPVL